MGKVEADFGIIEIYTPRARLFLAMLVLMSLAVASAWFGVLAWNDLVTDAESAIGDLLLAILCLLLFAGCGFLGLIALIRNRPAVVISKEGITHGTPGFGLGLIKWNEISEIDTYRNFNYGAAYVMLRLHDPKPLLDRLNPVRRVIAQINRLTSKADINIPTTGLKISANELARTIKRYQREFRKSS